MQEELARVKAQLKQGKHTRDLEDTGKLVVIVAATEMSGEYLIKQKILPDHINI